ncbi:MAG: HEAT repeat domain-containing protein [Thermoguttaceae bacterium]
MSTAFFKTATWLALAAAVALAGCGKTSRSTGEAVSPPRPKPQLPAELPKDVLPLVEGLYAEDSADRAWAASRLKHLGPAAGRAVPYLADILADGNWQVRREAAEALGKAGDLRAVEPLIEVLGNRDGDWSVRAAAARSLGQLGDPRAVAPLAALLNDMNTHVRHAAVVGLGRIGTPETLGPLTTAARSDGDSAVRLAAAEAIRK